MEMCFCTHVWAVWLWAWCGPTKPVGEGTQPGGVWGSPLFIWFRGYFHSTTISPSSSDGSGTPGQSSPPPRGSCGSTPGPTTPCPRLFAVDGDKKKTESEHSGWNAWFSDSFHVNGDHQSKSLSLVATPSSSLAHRWWLVCSLIHSWFQSQASPKTWLVCQTRERRFTAV